MTATDVATVEAVAGAGLPTRPCTPPALQLELRQRVGRIVECQKRPDLIPREPSLTQSERRALEAVLPAYRAYLKPGTKNEISYSVTRLRAHYFVPYVPDPFGKALADDWAEDLGSYPLWVVDLACKRYRRREADRSPRPADIIALCDEIIGVERQLMREIDLALAVPSSDDAEQISAPPACTVWREHYTELVADFGQNVYDAWFKTCIPESDIEGVLTLAVPSNFIADHIDKNYKEDLQKTLGRTVQLVQRAYSSNANWAKEHHARVEQEMADREARRRGPPPA